MGANDNRGPIPTYEVVDDQNVKEIKVLMMENCVATKIITMAVPFCFVEEDIVIFIFPDHQIYKEDWGYKLVNGNRVQKITLTEISDSMNQAYNFKMNIQSSTMRSPSLQKFDNFDKYVNSEKLSDVTLCIQGRIIHAHKIILANKSPVFEAMFMHEMMESQKNKVEINDIDYYAMLELICYIYTGKLNDDEMNYTYQNFSNILMAANKYCVDCLKRKCEEELSIMFTCENVLDGLLLADLYNAVKLRKEAISFIVENIGKILELPSYKTFVESHADISIEIVCAIIAKQKNRIRSGK